MKKKRIFTGAYTRIKLWYLTIVRANLIKHPIEEAAGLSAEACFDKINREIKQCEELLSK